MDKVLKKRKASIQRQLLVAFTTIMISIVLILGGGYYYFFYQGVLETSTSYSHQLAEQLCRNVELYYDEIIRKTNSLSHQSDIKYYGDYFHTLVPNEKTDEIKRILFEMILSREDIDDINILYDGKNIVSMFGLYEDDVLMSMSQYYSVDAVYLCGKIVPIFSMNKYGTYTLPIVKSVYTPDELNGKVYYILVNVDMSRIDSIFFEINLGEGSGALIKKREDDSGYSPNGLDAVETEIIREIQKRNLSYASNEIIYVAQQEYLISINPIRGSELDIVVYNPIKNLTKNSRKIRRMMLFSVVFVIGIAFFVIRVVSLRFTRSITTLATHMEAVSKDNMSVIPGNCSSYETEILYDKFNGMIRDISTLLKDINEKSKLKRKAELYALQSQINPHFIYNTLDSINAMAALNGSKDIMKMTISLGRLLRISINTKEEFITIRKEIEHVQHYLKIQMVRYSDRFKVEFDVQEDVLECKVVKLILQPLIENAIYHGIKLKGEKGKIYVKIYGQEEKIYFRVCDNGVGVSKNKMEEIVENLKSNKSFGGKESVGIYNVDCRIKLYYGAEYGVIFQSNEGEGTNVQLTIPKRGSEVE